MLDINNTLDLLKIKFYNEWLYMAHHYDEDESPYHKALTTRFVKEYVDPLNLPKDASILDLGCGPGYFLDEMKDRGYTNVTGVTLSQQDVDNNTKRGHAVKQYDFSFLPQSDGFIDESVDFIFLRHVFEHSPYPIFTLMEYNRLLKLGGKIYIEVPAPDCDRPHEYNKNHYSIFGATQLKALLDRTGFKADIFNEIEFELEFPAENEEKKRVKERYYCIVATKKRPLDIK